MLSDLVFARVSDNTRDDSLHPRSVTALERRITVTEHPSIADIEVQRAGNSYREIVDQLQGLTAPPREWSESDSDELSDAESTSSAGDDMAEPTERLVSAHPISAPGKTFSDGLQSKVLNAVNNSPPTSRRQTTNHTHRGMIEPGQIASMQRGRRLNEASEEIYDPEDTPEHDSRSLTAFSGSSRKGPRKLVVRKDDDCCDDSQLEPNLICTSDLFVKWTELAFSKAAC